MPGMRTTSGTTARAPNRPPVAHGANKSGKPPSARMQRMHNTSLLSRGMQRITGGLSKISVIINPLWAVAGFLGPFAPFAVGGIESGLAKLEDMKGSESKIKRSLGKGASLLRKPERIAAETTIAEAIDYVKTNVGASNSAVMETATTVRQTLSEHSQTVATATANAVPSQVMERAKAMGETAKNIGGGGRAQAARMARYGSNVIGAKRAESLANAIENPKGAARTIGDRIGNLTIQQGVEKALIYGGLANRTLGNVSTFKGGLRAVKEIIASETGEDPKKISSLRVLFGRKLSPVSKQARKTMFTSILPQIGINFAALGASLKMQNVADNKSQYWLMGIQGAAQALGQFVATNDNVIGSYQQLVGAEEQGEMTATIVAMFLRTANKDLHNLKTGENSALGLLANHALQQGYSADQVVQMAGKSKAELQTLTQEIMQTNNIGEVKGPHTAALRDKKLAEMAAGQQQMAPAV